MISNLNPVVVYDEMINALEQMEANTSYEEVDITEFVYDKDSEWGTITSPLGNKFELTEWSCRQICRISSIPFTFFKKSTPELAKDTFMEWVRSVKENPVNLAVRHYGKSKNVVRAVLGHGYPTDIRNSDILKAVSSINMKFEIEHAAWLDEMDSPIVRTRFVLHDVFAEIMKDDNVHIGVDVVCSELGAAPIMINILAYRTICSNGAIAVFDNKPFFYFDYKHGSCASLPDVVSACADRIADDSQVIFDALTNSTKVKVAIDQAKLIVSEMVKADAINKGIAEKTIYQIDKNGVSSGWDVANALTSSAKQFRDALRLRYETAAGALLGLSLTRKKGVDDEYAVTAPDRALPPGFKQIS